MTKNNIFKKTLSVFLILLITNLPSYAANWITITAENGQSADLDLDSIRMSIYTVEYKIRITDGDISYINSFSTELYKEGTPTAVISSVVYADGEQIDEEVYHDYNYRSLEEGSLQAEIFDVLSKNLPAGEFNQRQTKWTNYLNRQQKSLQKTWKPEKFKNMKKECITDDGEQQVYVCNTYIETDKNGNILTQYSSNMKDLIKIKKIEPLPEEYNQKTFTLTINKNYYKYKGATKTKKPLVIQTSPNSATVKISKNSRPFILGHIQYALLKSIKKLDTVYKGEAFSKKPVILELLTLPAEIVLVIVSALTCSFFILIFAVMGGDIEDV